MFDGSFRTNKREINHAGKSASSRSSRKTNLNVARQQRQARAAAKLKLNGAKCIQRSWRGSRCRRGVALELDDRFQSTTQELSSNNGNGARDVAKLAQNQRKVSEAASLLAFRMSPALLPFYAYRHIDSAAAAASLGKKKWGADDVTAELHLRWNLLSLENILRQFRSQQSHPVISQIAARKIVAITPILLRQSINFLSHNNTDTVEVETKQQENRRLVELLDYLLESTFSPDGISNAFLTTDCDNLWTNRPSDYYMGVIRKIQGASTPSAAGSMINFFLCFGDYVSYSENCINGGGAASMEIDGVPSDKDGTVEIQKMLKWCCQIVLLLASSDQKQEAQNMGSLMHPLMYQQGLALLASILFTSLNVNEGSSLWMNEQLNLCLVSLEQCISGIRSNDQSTSPSMHWRPILIHYLSTAMSVLSGSTCANSGRRSSIGGCKVPGLMTSFSSFISKSTTASIAAGNDVSSMQFPWMEALRDSLSSKEFIVMNQVLSHTHACEKPTQQEHELLTYAIPTILQYALQNQQDLAILASFAAQGENITSWFSGNSANGAVEGATSIATAAAAAAFNGDEMDDSEDDEQDQDTTTKQTTTGQKSTTSTGRYSRQDLQTLPKLDALYQTGCLRAKKMAVDRLQSLLRSHGKQVTLLISLAEKIGKGEWIQSLGNTLFSSTAALSSASVSPLLVPLSLSFWQSQAQVAYTSALATVMTTCTGIKAGRNAASPLLARLAFHEEFVSGLWERSSRNMPMFTPLSNATDSSVTIAAYEVFSSFCDTFSHHLLAVSDDDFLERYHQPAQNDQTFKAPDPNGRINAKEIVLTLKKILNDLYWIRPVLASDFTITQNDPESKIRFQRARLLLSGTKLWNSLYERWCRLYRVVQFCNEDCWWFPHLASRGKHDNNPIIQSQVTTLTGQGNDDMDDSSVESANMDDDQEEPAPMSANDAGGDALATAFRDPKMARVLTYIPQAMPFTRRVNLFDSLVEADKVRTQDETMSFRQMMDLQEGEETEISGRERVTIRRDALYGDSKDRLNRLGKRLRKKVQVTFVNKHGQQEAGIDGGGVFKEFLDDLIKDAFLPHIVREESDDGTDDDSVVETHSDFFSVTPLQTLKVNTALNGNNAVLSDYEFLGRVLGKSIYESILVEPQFCLPFLNKLLGKQNSLDDLKNLDPEYYKNLKSLRNMSAQEIIDLGLTFELHDSATTTIELMRGGSSIPVTKDNVIQYIHLVSHQKMNIRGSRQTSAFLHGFRDIIPAQWVRLFSAYELQKLISGDDAVKGIDVQGMMSAMRYSGGLHPSQPIVQWLWRVVDEMTPDQQRKFLKFMTSCSRQPLLGFGSMVPAPCIQQTRLRETDRGHDVAESLDTGNVRLPTSSTCMNLLKLPKYTSKEMLKEKLLYAIESAAGFELS